MAARLSRGRAAARIGNRLPNFVPTRYLDLAAGALQARSSRAWTSTPAAWSRARGSSTSATPAIRSSWPRTTTRQGADELVFLDITATSDKRATVVELARRAADERVRAVHDRRRRARGRRRPGGARRRRRQGLRQLRRGRAAGAARRAGASVFGAQCVVLAIDAKRRADGPTRSTSPAAARRPAATPSSGRARASSAGRGRSCSPDGPRRHQGRLRPRAHARDRRRRRRAGDRLRRRRASRSTWSTASQAGADAVLARLDLPLRHATRIPEVKDALSAAGLPDAAYCRAA